MRPTHGLTDEGTALCGAKIGGKKTKITGEKEAITCINCLRVLDGEARAATRKTEVNAKLAEDRKAWTGKAIAKAARIAKDIEGSASLIKALDKAMAELDKLV